MGHSTRRHAQEWESQAGQQTSREHQVSEEKGFLALKGMSSLGRSRRFSNLGEGHFPSNDRRVLNAELCNAPGKSSRWSRGCGRGFWKTHYHFSNLVLFVPTKHFQARLYTHHNSEMQTSRAHLAGNRHSLSRLHKSL